MHSLIPAYRKLHQAGKFPGYSIEPFVPGIAELVAEIPTQSILDYGCGLGHQYKLKRVHDAWGGLMPTLYDPAVPGIDSRPVGQFDGVICTEVLEHVPADELDAVIKDIFRFARLWCYISVCCRPAKPNKNLPDGRNAHVTIRPQEWWIEHLGELWPEDKDTLRIGFTP
jgi:hypothetical protein